MRLIEALNTLNAARDRTERREFDLLCGFQPLHLGTLLAAYLQQGELQARVSCAKAGTATSSATSSARLPTRVRGPRSSSNGMTSIRAWGSGTRAHGAQMSCPTSSRESSEPLGG